MMIHILLAIFLIIYILCSPANGQDNSNDLIKNDTVNALSDLKLKSKGTGMFFAIFPGSVIHGAGHFYAGSYLTGALLFLTETIGAGMMVMAAITSSPGPFGGQSGNSSEGVTVLFAAGPVLFFFSWVYDILFTPRAVENYNKRQIEKHSRLFFHLGMNESKETFIFALSYRF